MNKLRLPDFSKRLSERAKLMLGYIKNKYLEPGSGNEVSQVFNTLFDKFKDFFTTLKTPEFKGWVIRPTESRDPAKFHDEFSKIQRDLQVGMTDSLRLADVAVSTFNYGTTLNDIVMRKMREVTSISLDVQMMNADFARDIFIIGDSFSDSSLVDSDFVSERSRAESPLNTSHFTLARLGVLSVLSEVSSNMKVDIIQSPGNSVYEGKLYAPLDEGIEPAGEIKFGKVTLTDYSIAVGDPFSERLAISMADAWSMKTSLKTALGEKASGTSSTNPNSEKSEPIYEQPWTAAGYPGLKGDINVIKNPTMEALKPLRDRALDGNADTYWQIESIHPPALPTTREVQARLVKNYYHPDEFQDLPWQEVLDQINQFYTEAPPPLEVKLTIELGQAKRINLITLNPLIFCEQSWLQVTNIRTSSDGSEFVQLPEFASGRYENILTSSANSELSEEEAQLLGPDNFDYSGFGIWVFSPVDAKFIEITLKQPVSYGIDYEIVRVHLARTIKFTYCVWEQDDWFDSAFGKKNDPVIYIGEQEEERAIDLSYVDSLQLNSPDGEEEDYAEDVDNNPVLIYKHKTSKWDWSGRLNEMAWVLQPKDYSRIYIAKSEGDWEVTDVEIQQRTDKSRYAIGVRDIDIISTTYDEMSSITSKRFSVPKPITKVSIVVNEFIPSEFTNISTSPWIDYYVSFDDIAWNRLAPLSVVPVVDETGATIPQIININAHLTAAEQNINELYLDIDPAPQYIRFKAVLKRPTGDNWQAFSPVLKDYRLKMAVEGGVT